MDSSSVRWTVNQALSSLENGLCQEWQRPLNHLLRKQGKSAFGTVQSGCTKHSLKPTSRSRAAVARRTHYPKVTGSIPVSATTLSSVDSCFS